ncbi:hypothetical protein FU139_04455 [Burkholderia territorii]|nr:conserved hypothetical protein [Burkholderia pseudomallei 668]ARL99743.1 hypothetical protein BOC59_06385 [Burkholderia pseudomallei]TXG24349.1 hypothetical protein FU139_04455 [Burkholderia territorii]
MIHKISDVGHDPQDRCEDAQSSVFELYTPNSFAALALLPQQFEYIIEFRQYTSIELAVIGFAQLFERCDCYR